MRQAQSVTGPDCLFVNLFYIYKEGRGAPKSMLSLGQKKANLSDK